ncbi:metalloendopeptidase OMA1, mitochondrial-like [Diaphorina citri]|uniref:Metalloendopeptidase OMA1, mitochondrial n=1 Tax=Diaphorina citri TaxID=121845 RepID=A0A3Q0IWL9_DIACI|nr:metalloendopeptidase OMA1, mitochondrial-like [Diaphorina citri]
MRLSGIMFNFKHCLKQVTSPLVRNVCLPTQKHIPRIYGSKKYSTCLNFQITGHQDKHLTRVLFHQSANHQLQVFNIRVLRCFHTSQPKNALPGFIYLIFKPILRVGAIVIARISRKWWSKLSPDQKKIILSQIKKHQDKIAGITLTSIGLAYIYYFLHLETCPITGRQKFIIVKPNQLNDVTQIAYDNFIEEHGNQVLPLGHPAYKRVGAVVKRLIDANKVYMEHNNFKYPITIIDDPLINAFVFPDGRIFMFTGMFQLCQTDDELATVLSHELSHTLLKHVAEKLSNKTFLEILYIVPLMIIWFLLPDLGAIVTQSIIFELPFEREMETEADEVGLKLMARACYDVRVAPLFWQKMALKETQDQVGPKMEEYLSTHPSHENRANNLESKMKEALDIRKECNCLPLGPLFIPRLNPLAQLFNVRPATPA